MKIFDIYLLFWIYSFLGWIIETTYVSYKSKKFINRGFFLGPYCPIYGTGGVLLLFFKNYRNDYFVVFIIAIFICSLVEYLTSYFLELIYRVRWWDYTERFFNINGRICLANSICFGLFGLLAVCFLNPFFTSLITLLNTNIKSIIIIIIFIITTTDMLITFSAMFDFRKYISSLKEKTLTSIFKTNVDSTEEMSKRVKNSLKEKSFIHNHLLKAYSGFKIYKANFFKKGEELIKYRNWKMLENSFVIGTFISIIIGYIIGKLINSIELSIIICLVSNVLIIKLYNRRKND